MLTARVTPGSWDSQACTRVHCGEIDSWHNNGRVDRTGLIEASMLCYLIPFFFVPAAIALYVSFKLIKCVKAQGAMLTVLSVAAATASVLLGAVFFKWAGWHIWTSSEF